MEMMKCPPHRFANRHLISAHCAERDIAVVMIFLHLSVKIFCFKYVFRKMADTQFDHVSKDNATVKKRMV